VADVATLPAAINDYFRSGDQAVRSAGVAHSFVLIKSIAPRDMAVGELLSGRASIQGPYRPSLSLAPRSQAGIDAAGANATFR